MFDIGREKITFEFSYHPVENFYTPNCGNENLTLLGIRKITSGN